MALNSVTDRMSEQIEWVVARRQQNWDYIKRAHQSRVHWLNVMKLSKATIEANFPPEKLQKRIRRWFLLGLSLGRLLELGEGATLVRALSQLIEEYEHYISAKKDLPHAAREGLGAGAALVAAAAQLGAGGEGVGQGPGGGTTLLAPFLFLGVTHGSASVTAVAQAAAAAAAAAAASSGSGLGSTLGGSASKGGAGGGGLGLAGVGGSLSSSGDRDASDPSLKPSLQKNARGQVVYAYLQTGAAAVCMGIGGGGNGGATGDAEQQQQLDYCELVCSLCDVLSLLYAKFLDASCTPPAVHHAVLRADRKLRALVLSKLVTDLGADVAGPLLKAELSSILNHMFLDERPQAQTAGGTKRFIQLDEHAPGDANDFEDEEE